MPSFSLIGALEFRRVVTSLQQQASTSTLSQFSSPVSPYPAGHYHHHSFPRRSGRSRTPSINHLTVYRDPWDAALGLPLHDRSPPQGTRSRLLSEEMVLEEEPIGTHSRLSPPPQIPLISVTPDPPASLAPTETEIETETETDGSQSPFHHHYLQGSKRGRLWVVAEKVYHTLFPTLHHFKAKSILGKIAAVFAAPAVMALTLTLPVVVTSYDDLVDAEEKANGVSIHETDFVGDMGGRGGEGRLIDFEEEGVERMLVAEDEVEHELHELKFNKWLMAVQCILGPMFCVGVLLGECSGLCTLIPILRYLRY